LGNFLSGAATGPVQFVLARGITGLGYGFCLISFQGFVLANTSPSKKARAMANLGAGIIAGSVCGGAAGAMLAETMGFASVFYIAGAFLFSVILFVFLFMRDTLVKTEKLDGTHQKGLTLNRVRRFLFSRNVFSLVAFNTIPNGLCMWGFLYFLTPIYLNDLGASKSDIGRVLMVFGLCQIYVAPLISKIVDYTENKKILIAMNGLLCSLGYVLFHFYGGLAATAFIILLIGISHSFGYPSRIVFLLNQEETQNLGEAKAISVYRTTERTGQLSGPLIFGALIGIYSIESTLAIAGAVFLILTLLFIGIAKQAKEEHLSQDEVDDLFQDYQETLLDQDEVDKLLDELE
jgi:predicted MFS family arabinose efflux permease